MQHSNFSTSGTYKYFCLIQEYRLLIITNTQRKKERKSANKLQSDSVLDSIFNGFNSIN